PKAATAQSFTFDESLARQRAESVDRCVRAWASSDATMAALAAEIGSLNAATVALADLVATLPKTIDDWIAAAHNAIDAHTPRRWLMILPDSHALVGVPGLALGVTAGLDLSVRLPRQLAAPSSSL